MAHPRPQHFLWRLFFLLTYFFIILMQYVFLFNHQPCMEFDLHKCVSWWFTAGHVSSNVLFQQTSARFYTSTNRRLGEEKGVSVCFWKWKQYNRTQLHTKPKLQRTWKPLPHKLVNMLWCQIKIFTDLFSTRCESELRRTYLAKTWTQLCHTGPYVSTRRKS